MKTITTTNPKALAVDAHAYIHKCGSGNCAALVFCMPSEWHPVPFTITWKAKPNPADLLERTAWLAAVLADLRNTTGRSDHRLEVLA